MSEIEIGVIGGSGLYKMPGLEDVEEREIDTPFGTPSGKLVIGTLHGRRVVFLPRHGAGHVLNPSEIPYRANIYALKSLGVKYVVAVNACGSLRETYAPGHIVIPDQLFDYTKGIRPSTFFENGIVAHVSVADPLTPELNTAVADSVRNVGGKVHEGGHFITIEGPRFSTKAESHTYRQWGMSIIGMTTCPEAFLAAEAEMAFTSMAHVTDYDVWHESEEPVTLDMVIRTVQHNTKIAQEAIADLVGRMDEWAGEWSVHHGLKDAIMTHKTMISEAARERLGILVSEYLG